MITREELNNKIDIILKKHSRLVYEDAEVCETINAYLCDDLCDVDFNDAKLRRHILQKVRDKYGILQKLLRRKGN